jgi:hypothetical protein
LESLISVPEDISLAVEYRFLSRVSILLGGTPSSINIKITSTITSLDISKFETNLSVINDIFSICLFLFCGDILDPIYLVAMFTTSE